MQGEKEAGALLGVTVVCMLLAGCGVKEKLVSEDNAPMSVAQAFQSVLLNEKEFSCTDKKPHDWLKVVRDFEGYLKEIPYGYEGKTSITQFAIVDMDGDTLPEVVLAIEEYYGYIILRYREGQIFGNVVGIREMGSLNIAGAFYSSSGAADGGIGKFYFVGDTIVSNEAVRMTDQDAFYIHDTISDKETWDEMNNLFAESPEVEWYDFTEEQINKAIVENPSFTELPSEPSDNAGKRQQYIDSLSYLIELTYDMSKKKEEDYKKDAKAYLEGCVQEMDKIYQLCQEKLSGEALEALQEEQERWLENYKRRTNRELAVSKLGNMDELLESDIGHKYWIYGDMILRRTLALIDLYYEWDFYDSLF